MLEDSIFLDFFLVNVVLKINSMMEVMSLTDTARFKQQPIITDSEDGIQQTPTNFR
jgi:hypothetical protein